MVTQSKHVSKLRITLNNKTAQLLEFGKNTQKKPLNIHFQVVAIKKSRPLVSSLLAL